MGKGSPAGTAGERSAGEWMSGGPDTHEIRRSLCVRASDQFKSPQR